MSKLLETQSPLIMSDDRSTLLVDLLSNCNPTTQIDKTPKPKNWAGNLYLELQNAIRTVDEEEIRRIFCELSTHISPETVLKHYLSQIRRIWQEEEQKSTYDSEPQSHDTMSYK